MIVCLSVFTYHLLLHMAVCTVCVSAVKKKTYCADNISGETSHF